MIQFLKSLIAAIFVSTVPIDPGPTCCADDAKRCLSDAKDADVANYSEPNPLDVPRSKIKVDFHQYPATQTEFVK